MPLHDWSRVPVGTYHHFHQDWTMQLARQLNRGVLPPGFLAMADQRVVSFVPDVVATRQSEKQTGATAVASTPYASQVRRIETDAAVYARKANRLSVRTDDGVVVAIIEIVSPGNKDSKNSISQFLRKLADFLRRGVNVLLVDPFPPTKRDPEGIHHALWDRIATEPFDPPPPGKPLTAAAYDASDGLTAYVEPLAVGDRLPDLPLFLGADFHVPAPLEASYVASWEALPEVIRRKLES